MVVAACGGSGGGSSGTRLSGVAATGNPVVGVTATITCGNGTVAATTAADGTWSADVIAASFPGAPIVYPCTVSVTGGSLPAGTTLTGYATSQTTVNVTPLTTLIGAYAKNAAGTGAVTQALLDAATTQVYKLLTDAGFKNLPADPLTATFKPVQGDAHDDLIEALMLTLQQQSTTLDALVTTVTKSGTPGTVTIITPSAAAFNSLPDPFPLNMPSLGFEATGLTSLGDRIVLAANTPRKLRDVTIAMSSWACQSGAFNTADCVSAAGATFTHPITLNIYNDETNALVATRTQTFTIPYRPSTDSSCTGGRWKATDGSCNNGKAFKIVFDLNQAAVTLPGKVRYAISYNTRTYGPHPIGAAGPYDSLNVGVYDSTKVQPTVGTDPDLGYLIWNGTPSQEDAGLMARFNVGS